jgi:VanZ family protein
MKNPLQMWQINRTTWITGGWLLIGLVCYASLFPVPQPKMTFNHIDKIEHFVSYGVLMLWFSQVLRGKQRFLLLMALITMGILIEFIQPYTGRMFDPLDMLANSLGALIAWLLSLKGADILYKKFEKASSPLSVE